jgi:general secretion pathway protein K
MRNRAETAKRPEVESVPRPTSRLLLDSFTVPLSEFPVADSPARLPAVALAKEDRFADSSDARQRGSALLLVLCTILLLAALIVSVVSFVKPGVDEYAAWNGQFHARLLAETGAAYALSPQVSKIDTDLLNQKLENGDSFQTTITSESTRLNVNTLLQLDRGDILERLFRSWGLSDDKARDAVTALTKWVGPVANPNGVTPNNPSADNPISSNPMSTGNPTPSPSASPAPGTTNQPTTNQPGTGTNTLTRPFLAVEQMSLVPAFKTVMDAQPTWADYFTVWTDGKIDVNEATADQIELLTAVSSAQADEFIKHRKGARGIDGEQPYTDLSQVQAVLGLSSAQFELLSPLLGLNSTLDRIESRGSSGPHVSTLTVVVNRNSSPPQYLLWREN